MIRCKMRLSPLPSSPTWLGPTLATPTLDWHWWLQGARTSARQAHRHRWLLLVSLGQHQSYSLPHSCRFHQAWPHPQCASLLHCFRVHLLQAHKQPGRSRRRSTRPRLWPRNQCLPRNLCQLQPRNCRRILSWPCQRRIGPMCLMWRNRPLDAMRFLPFAHMTSNRIPPSLPPSLYGPDHLSSKCRSRATGARNTYCMPKAPPRMILLWQPSTRSAAS